MRSNDLYDTLGVKRSASQAEIRKTYRRLARQFHPDVNPDDQEAEERFKAISVAFDVLSDPEKRALYDEFGEEAIRLGFDPEKARAVRDWQQWSGGQRTGGGFGGGSPFGGGDPFGGGGAGGGVGLDDLLGNLFHGRGGRARSVPRRGGNLEGQVTITLREAVLGTERQITVTRPEAFGGARPAESTDRSTQLKVKVPAGIEDGQTIRLAGQGYPGAAGGPQGDLLLRIDVAPHPLIRREGRDLFLDLPVTVGEALLGAKVEVPTFQGNVSLTIPAGSQGGSKLRLRGKGLPETKGHAAGDLYVTLAIKVPDADHDSADVRDAAERLERAYRADVREGLVL